MANDAARAGRAPKKFRKQLTSPFGILKYPKLNAPDYGTDQYPDPDGSYNTKLVLERGAEGVDAFLMELEGLMKMARSITEEALDAMPVPKRKKIEERLQPAEPYEEELDDEGQVTGRVVLRVKMKAGGTRKDGSTWSARPTLVDAFGRRMPSSVSIWGGSKARVTFDAVPDFWEGAKMYGVQRKLLGVQVVELVSSGERNASSLGFGVVDGGFSVDTVEASDDEKVPSEGAGEHEFDGNF